MNSANSSQYKIRNFYALYKQAKNRVKECQNPTIILTKDHKSGKLLMFGDDRTVEKIELEPNLLEKLTSFLTSDENEKNLKFVDRKEKEKCPLNLLPVNLFKVDYRNWKDLDPIYRGVFKSLSYGKRGKQFGKDENRPVWFKNDFPDWNLFNSATIPKEYTKNKNEVKYKIIVAAYQHYLSDEKIELYRRKDIEEGDGKKLFIEENSEKQEFYEDVNEVFTVLSEEIDEKPLSNMTTFEMFEGFKKDLKKKFEKKKQNFTEIYLANQQIIENNTEKIKFLENNIEIIKNDCLEKKKTIKELEQIGEKCKEEKNAENEYFNKKILSLQEEISNSENELLETKNIREEENIKNEKKCELIKLSIEHLESENKKKDKLIIDFNDKLNLCNLNKNENVRKRKLNEEDDNIFRTFIKENKKCVKERLEIDSKRYQELKDSKSKVKKRLESSRKENEKLKECQSKLEHKNEKLSNTIDEILYQKQKVQSMLGYKKIDENINTLFKRLSGSTDYSVNLGKKKIALPFYNCYSKVFIETLVMAGNRLIKVFENVPKSNECFGKLKKHIFQVKILEKLQIQNSYIFVSNQNDQIVFKKLLGMFEQMFSIQLSFLFTSNPNLQIKAKNEQKIFNDSVKQINLKEKCTLIKEMQTIDSVEFLNVVKNESFQSIMSSL